MLQPTSILTAIVLQYLQFFYRGLKTEQHFSSGQQKVCSDITSILKVGSSGVLLEDLCLLD